jgi:hypothetical protein
MVSPFPGGVFSGVWVHSAPLHGGEIKEPDGVKAKLIESSSSKEDYLVIACVVVDGVIGSLLRQLTCGLYPPPFGISEVEKPEVI